MGKLNKERERYKAAETAFFHGKSPEMFNHFQRKGDIEAMIARLVNEGKDENVIREQMRAGVGLRAKMEMQDKISAYEHQGFENAVKMSGAADRAGAIKSAWETVRKKLDDSINKALNTLPAGLDAKAKNFITGHVGRKFDFVIGTDANGVPISIGANDRGKFMSSIGELVKNDEFIKSTGGMTAKQADKAMLAWCAARQTSKGNWASLPSIVREMRDAAKKNVAMGPSGGKMHTQYLETWATLLESAGKSAQFRKMADEYFKKLDFIGDRLVGAGILSEKIPDYFHNVVSVAEHGDPWDDIAEGFRHNLSDYRKRKKWNTLDYLKEGGVMASDSFVEMAGYYSKNTANALRMKMFASNLRAEAERKMDDPGRMKIKESADVESPLVVQSNGREDWKPPEDGSGNAYRSIGSIKDAWKGMYVHPQFYDWLAANYREAPTPKGFMRTAVRLSQLFKSNLLVAGYGPVSFHGLSLTQKAGWANYAASDKKGLGSFVKSFWDLRSINSEGLQAAARNDATYLKLVEAGLAMHQGDALLAPIMAQQFNSRGKRTVFGSESIIAEKAATLAEYWAKYTNWSHDQLFTKWFTGLKIGLGMKMTQTQWFEKMVAEKGLDEAYRTVAKVLNDSMGGQNLELMGRGRVTQQILQFSLLAPDWQESKYRRLFGSTLSQDPDIRKQYSVALTAELLSVALTTWVMQNVFDEMAKQVNPNHKSVSAEQMMANWLNGHFGSIHLGKTDKGRDIWAKGFGSVSEDYSPLFKVFRDYAESISGQKVESMLGIKPPEESEMAKYSPLSRIYKPLTEEAATVIRNRASPALRPIVGGAFKPSREPSQFDAAILPLPIWAQQAAFGVRGGFGDTPRSTESWINAAWSALAGYFGIPIEVRSPADPRELKKSRPTAFPTPMAEGGPVVPGRQYLAGEAGPEVLVDEDGPKLIDSPTVFTPQKRGKIIPFDPEGPDFDYETAIKHGMRPDPETKHWGSRVELTEEEAASRGLPMGSGIMLKGASHETWNKALAGEEMAGFKVVKGKDGRYYSVPKPRFRAIPSPR